MLAEWKLGPGDAKPGMDEAEVEAFTDMVRAFTIAKPARPVNVFVPWCLNDYQIDIATPEGRAEYKRMFDVAAELGADFAVFAPTNSDLAKREDSTDDWSWETCCGPVQPEDPEERMEPEDRPIAVGAGDARPRRREEVAACPLYWSWHSRRTRNG
jgi:hypothetical protein